MSEAEDKHGWPPRGRPIRDAALRGRAGDVLARASDVVPELLDPAPGLPADVDQALTTLDGVTDLLLARPGVDVALVAELRDVHADLRVHRALQRYDAMAGIQKGLARLRGLRSTKALLEQAPREIGQALGFDRVIVSRVEDSQWIPVNIYIRDDDSWADEILAAALTEPEPLDHMLLESEMARRRTPMLVLDVQGSEHVHRRIADVSQSRSYVAAPIMPEGGVIGFLHADHHLSRRDPDEFDRDTLFAFAEAFGIVFERAVLAERLQRQADQVRALTASLSVVFEDLQDAEVRMAPEAEEADGDDDGRTRRVRAPVAGGRLEALLTRREIEVTRLMAGGATNGEIASRLVISEGTVKSHVKHILRKLHASNRAEASSKFMQLSALPRHADDAG